MDDAPETTLRSGRRWRRKVPAAGAPPPPAPPRSPVAEPASPPKPPVGGGAAATVQFACNVCLDTATDPVVTHCGHLFCWPCLYRWVHHHSPLRDCPVCKSAVDISPGSATLTPIYGSAAAHDLGADAGAHDGGAASSSAATREDPEVPPRPRGRRRGEFVDEARQRTQMQTLDRTRAAIDRVRMNLQAVEGLVREFTLRAARLRFGDVAVEVERVSVSAVTGTSPVPDADVERVEGGGRRRRSGGEHNTLSGGESGDNEDGVYRGTRRRRRLAMEEM